MTLSDDLTTRAATAGDELREALNAAREPVISLKAKRTAVLEMSPTTEVVTRRIEAFADRVAWCRQDLVPLPERFLEGASFGPPEDFDAGQVLMYYLRPLLVDAMLEAVTAAAEKRPSISEAERRKRLTELDAEILNAEMHEEVVNRAAEAAGFSVARRRDANPAVVLAPDEVLR